MTVKVYGYIKAPDETIPESLVVRFELTDIGAASQSIYVSDTPIEAVVANNGYFELNLWSNTASSVYAPYRVTIYQNENIIDTWTAHVPSGITQIGIDELYSLSGVREKTPLVYTTVSEALSKANEALTKINSMNQLIIDTEAAKNNANTAYNRLIAIDTYSKTQIDTKLASKSDTTHTHTFASLTSKPTTVAGYGITDAYTSTAVQSRGMNLITNGTGLMGNNYNFSSFTFTPSDVYTGAGSFLTSVRDAAITEDELIPVIPDNYYTLKLALKSKDLQANNYVFVYVAPYDIDNQIIAPIHYTWDNSTMTTLAQPLKVGDTKIYLTSAANWTQPKYNLGLWNVPESGSVIKIHKYRNAKGYTWPAKTYSRNTTGYAPYSFTTGVDTTNNVITLRNPWTIANPDDANGWPVGTPIGVSFSGSNYLYPTNISNTPIPDDKWTLGSGTFGSKQSDGTTVTTKFPEGAAFIKVGVLANRMQNTASTYPTVSNKTLVSGLYLTEINPQNLTNGLAGYTGTVSTGTKTLTITNGIITGVA